MKASLDRHLKNKGCTLSIVRDREFSSSKEVLEDRTKQLRLAGRGKRPNKARQVSEEEDEIRWKSGKLEVTRRYVSVYLGVVVLRVRYFEHALLQLKNCHHILPEKTNPLLHLFAEPHSLNSMSQSTTKTVSFHDNV